MLRLKNHCSLLPNYGIQWHIKSDLHFFKLIILGMRHLKRHKIDRAIIHGVHSKALMSYEQSQLSFEQMRKSKLQKHVKHIPYVECKIKCDFNEAVWKSRCRKRSIFFYTEPCMNPLCTDIWLVWILSFVSYSQLSHLFRMFFFIRDGLWPKFSTEFRPSHLIINPFIS